MIKIMHGKKQRCILAHRKAARERRISLRMQCAAPKARKSRIARNSVVGVWLSAFQGRCAASFNERAASIPSQSGCVQPNGDESESISMYCAVILCKSNIDGYEQL